MPSPLVRTLAWSVDSRRFTLELVDDMVTLRLPDGEAVTLAVEEWAGVREGLDALTRFRRKAATAPRVDRGTPDAPNNGQAWTTELDTVLCQGWYAGDGLAVLAARFGRTEGSIASRLVKLDCVTDSDQARARP